MCGICVLTPFSEMAVHIVILAPRWPGASSSSHRCPTICYGFRGERHVSWKRFATVCNRVWDIFSLVWWLCQKCQPNQQQRVYKPCGIKETARTMDKWSHFICVRCSSLYATIEVKSFHMCPLQLAIHNNWSEVISYVSAAARYTQQLKWSHFICVHCSSLYATIEVKSFHMCPLQLSIRNNWSEVISYVSAAARYTQQLKKFEDMFVVKVL